MIRCPNCNSPRSKVARVVQRSNRIHRRRICQTCQHIYSTDEVPAGEEVEFRRLPLVRMSEINARLKAMQ